jgi:hypothetical protein
MKSLLILLASLAIISAVSCVSRPNPTLSDIAKMKDLQKKLEGLYSFEFEKDLYIRAQCLRDEIPSNDEAMEIYKIFWFNSDNLVRMDSNYVYLNFYGKHGKFLFQVHWDPKKSEVVISRTEHY